MPAIGLGMLWGAYTLVFWGWSLVKGYDISLTQLAIPGQFKGHWPPGVMPDTQVLGSGSSGGAVGPGVGGIAAGATALAQGVTRNAGPSTPATNKKGLT